MIFSIPLMLTNLLQVFFNLADVAVVGKFAGPIALGAVGSTTILCSLTSSFLVGMSSGINALTARYIGADDRDSESKVIHTGFIICAITGLGIMAGFILLSRPILTALGTKPELMDQALIYFRLYMLGSPAVALYNHGNAVLSAAGDTRRPLVILSLAGFINVILNLVFVLLLGMNADGVAIASIIAQYISCVLITRVLLTSSDHFRLVPACIKLDKNMAGRILAISLPSAIQYSMFAIANLFVQSAVNSFDHVTVEGNSAAMNADPIVYDMMAAFYTASTSFIAQNYGAGKMDRVRQTYLVTTVYSFGLGLILGLVFHFYDTQFLLLFTSDTGVITQGSIRLGIISLSYCLSAFMDNSIYAARGLGRTRVPMIIIILGAVVLRISWIFTIFAYFKTLQSLYLLYACSFTFTGILGNIYLLYAYRQAASELNSSASV